MDGTPSTSASLDHLRPRGLPAAACTLCGGLSTARLGVRPSGGCRCSPPPGRTTSVRSRWCACSSTRPSARTSTSTASARRCSARCRSSTAISHNPPLASADLARSRAAGAQLRGAPGQLHGRAGEVRRHLARRRHAAPQRVEKEERRPSAALCEGRAPSLQPASAARSQRLGRSPWPPASGPLASGRSKQERGLPTVRPPGTTPRCRTPSMSHASSRSWRRAPSALPEERRPFASLDHPKAQVAPPQPGAPPQHLRSLRRPR